MLRDVIRVLVEAAIKPKEANEIGLALIVGQGREQLDIILVDPIKPYNRIVDWINKTHYNKDTDSYEAFELHQEYNNVSEQYGAITIQEPRWNCGDAWEVTGSKAKNKYGPLMYDIAMSLVPSKTLVPDRHTVSAEASRVWKYYYTKRKDVIAKELDEDCWAPEHPVWLNHSYTMRGRGPGVARLLKNGEDLVRDIVKLSRVGPKSDWVSSEEVAEWLIDQYSTGM